MIGTPELLMILLLFVLPFFLWIWMLIDCLKRPDDRFAIGGNNAKLIWIPVIVFTLPIGALLYYFLILRKWPTGINLSDFIRAVKVVEL